MRRVLSLLLLAVIARAHGQLVFSWHGPSNPQANASLHRQPFSFQVHTFIFVHIVKPPEDDHDHGKGKGDDKDKDKHEDDSKSKDTHSEGSNEKESTRTTTTVHTPAGNVLKGSAVIIQKGTAINLQIGTPNVKAARVDGEALVVVRMPNGQTSIKSNHRFFGGSHTLEIDGDTIRTYSLSVEDESQTTAETPRQEPPETVFARPFFASPIVQPQQDPVFLWPAIWRRSLAPIQLPQH